jgi:hypothetical protein
LFKGFECPVRAEREAERGNPFPWFVRGGVREFPNQHLFFPGGVVHSSEKKIRVLGVE